MNGLETLNAIGATEIYRRTHISVDEAKALLEKNFDYFNRAKALGFIKILEREYDVDLSDWVAEFEEHKGRTQENGAIFVYAKEEQGRGLQMGLLAAVLIGGAVAAMLYWSDAEPKKQEIRTQVAQNALVAEAKEAITAAAAVEAEIQTPVETAKPEEPAEEAVEFYVSADQDLWVGIYYSDTGQRDGRIIRGRLDLDPERDQILTFGHGMFKLAHGERVFEPKSMTLQRFRFRDQTLTQMPAPQPNRPAENNQSGEQAVAQ